MSKRRMEWGRKNGVEAYLFLEEETGASHKPNRPEHLLAPYGLHNGLQQAAELEVSEQCLTSHTEECCSYQLRPVKVQEQLCTYLGI